MRGSELLAWFVTASYVALFFLLFDATILNQAVVFSAVGSWIAKRSDPLSIAANLAYSFPPCDGAPSVVRTLIFTRAGRWACCDRLAPGISKQELGHKGFGSC